MQASKQGKSEDTEKHRFCTFRLSGRLYGVNIDDVKEINTEVSFTPIYHASDEIKGYINIRGQIYLLLDLRRIFGFQDKEIDELSRVVLFMPKVGEPCGVLVDSIDDVVSVDEKMIENRRKNEKQAPDGIERRAADVGEGVCKLEDELLIILNAKQLLNAVTSMQRI